MRARLSKVWLACVSLVMNQPVSCAVSYTQPFCQVTEGSSARGRVESRDSWRVYIRSEGSQNRERRQLQWKEATLVNIQGVSAESPPLSELQRARREPTNGASMTDAKGHHGSPSWTRFEEALDRKCKGQQHHRARRLVKVRRCGENSGVVSH